ncbi:hypothetical protein V0288_19330 [Pannus brasiliensis CCIBt3594]|uniref:Uncharacterized protein n=1 Tax=Pannus brasiliensis CCIBt3594 TaxID=1427578 RepID=A0AAW9QXE9_9CHRO
MKKGRNGGKISFRSLYATVEEIASALNLPVDKVRGVEIGP